MLVKAKEGSKCPKEGKPRDYIADDVAEEVPDTAYYLRLVNDGSLFIVPDPAAGEQAAPAQDTGAGEEPVPQRKPRGGNKS